MGSVTATLMPELVEEIFDVEYNHISPSVLICILNLLSVDMYRCVDCGVVIPSGRFASFLPPRGTDDPLMLPPTSTWYIYALRLKNTVNPIDCPIIWRSPHTLLLFNKGFLRKG